MKIFLTERTFRVLYSSRIGNWYGNYQDYFKDRPLGTFQFQEVPFKTSTQRDNDYWISNYARYTIPST